MNTRAPPIPPQIAPIRVPLECGCGLLSGLVAGEDGVEEEDETAVFEIVEVPVVLTPPEGWELGGGG